MHLEARDKLSGIYDLGIGEIAKDNTRSLHVHVDKIGYKIVGEGYSNGNNWNIVVFDFKS